MQRHELEHLIRWQNQNTDLNVGLCLDPSDLCAAKLAAGRDKDWPTRSTAGLGVGTRLTKIVSSDLWVTFLG